MGRMGYGVVQDWPDDPSQAEPNLDVDRYILERAAARSTTPPAAYPAVATEDQPS
jgi:hypothetical protein